MTLDSAVAAAAITAIATIIVHWIESKRSREKLIEAVQTQSKDADAAFDKAMAVYAARTDEKLEELTRSVREHNNFAKRMPIVETKIENLEHRVDALAK